MRNVINVLLAEINAEQLMAVLLEVADTEPTEVVRAFDKVLGAAPAVDGVPLEVHQECQRLCDDELQDAAIKHLRNATGQGLFEAKDWIESYCYGGQMAVNRDADDDAWPEWDGQS